MSALYNIYLLYMLSLPQLQATINHKVRGKADLILYGGRSSGKTTLAKKVLNNYLGVGNYIDVNAIFAHNRDAFLYLVGQSFFSFIQSLDSRFAELAGEKKPKFIGEGYNQSLQLWLKSFKRFIQQHYEDFFSKIPRVYIFIDNLQQLALNEQFVKKFYYGLKSQIKILKFSFFFCAICHKSPMFSVSEPFRNIAIFIMPQPKFKTIIKAAIQNSELSKKLENAKIKSEEKKGNNSQQKNTVNVLQSLLKHIQTVLQGTFQSLSYQIQNLYLITKCFLEQVNLYVGNDYAKAKIWMSRNHQDQEKQLLKKLKTYGPVTLERVSNEISKKGIGIHEIDEFQSSFYMENYPNLIMTSIGLANGYSESDDHKRFIDVRKTKFGKTGSRNMSKKVADRNFKQDSKKIRHNQQRIIAISQVLQEQSSGSRLRQKQLPHHTMDFYGCIEYLREEGYLSYYGKSNGKYGGKICGMPKQSQVKDFMNKLALDYKQFTNKD